MKRLFPLVIILFSILAFSKSQGQTAADYGVQLEAQIQTSPPKVSLNWKKILGATSYNIQKKVKLGTAWTYITSTSDTFIQTPR